MSAMTRTRRFLALFTFLLACGGDDTTPGTDGGGGRDGGGGDVDGQVPTTDGGGRRDGGGRTDGGPPDPACALPQPFDIGYAYAQTLHVSTSGDDGSGDGSMGSPFATIDRAAQVATPGTRVLVAAGTYPAVYLGDLSGADGQPIAISADGDVTIDGSGGNGVQLSDANWLVIEGFTITGSSVHGMNIDDAGSADTPSHHIVLRNLTIPSAGSGGNNDCIKMSGIDDFWVVGSDVGGCNQGEIIDMVGCHRGVISGNYFHDPVGSGVQTKGGSSDTIIHGNVFERIPGRAVNAGGSTGLEFFRPIDAAYEAARIRVISNVFVEVGAMSGASIAYVGCDACVFANNTIVDPQTWIARILQESMDARFVPSRDGLFINNVIVLDTPDIRTWVNVGGGTAPETFVFGNNLWYATDQGPGWAGPDLGGTGIPPETGSIVQMDPAMVDRAGGNYRLMAGSPAAMAGRAVPGNLPADYDGVCYGDPPTLGAFEIP